MNFEENWLMGFRGKVVQGYGRTDDGRRRTASDHNSSS